MRPEQPQALAKGLIVNVLLVVIAVTVSLLLTELSIRIYRTVRYRDSLLVMEPSLSGPIRLDRKLGWKPKENYRVSSLRKSADGSESVVNLSQELHGFRAFGSLNSGRRRILIIGDSFTQAEDASDDQTYYSIAGRILDVEIFGHGCIGYGTLQEYMILDQYIDEIRPDLIVWQFCNNDFADNSLPIQVRTPRENTFAVKPYWEHGRIIYALALSERLGRDIPYWIQDSRLFEALLGRLRILEAKLAGSCDGLCRISNGQDLDLFERSAEVTDELVANIRKRAGSIPIVAIDCGFREPYSRTLKAISQRHGLRWLADDVDRAISAAEAKRVCIRAADGEHWNAVGQ